MTILLRLMSVIMIVIMIVILGGNCYNALWSSHANVCHEAGGFIYWRTALFDSTCVKPIEVSR